MEVAGLLFSVISFVDSAAKTGSVLAQIFRDSGAAGKHVHNATQRLEAQKNTVELWQGIWRTKAQRKLKPTIEEGFRETWGDEGYDMILKCLAQIKIKFAEAFRTLRSIDPDSFKDSPPLTTLSDESLSPASSSDRKSPILVESASDALLPKTRKHWYHHLSGSISKGKGKGIWRSSRSTSVSSLAHTSTAEELAELAQQALQHKMSPGTKFKWSIVHKEQIRLLVNDIDDWLPQLQTLASRCEEERNQTKAGNKTHPSGIRAAAKALHTALRNSPSSQYLEFRLEKERIDSTYFEQILGPVEYFDQTNRSFKFPLLISDSNAGSGPILLLAEAIYGPGASTTPSPPLGVTMETPLDEIINSLRDPESKNLKTSTLNHEFPKCTFADLLQAEATVDPLVALWKRLQLACIIAISVLHLYETSWISEHLETNDFHFFGSAASQYHEHVRMAPYVSAVQARPRASWVSKTPFDLLQRNPIAPSLLGSRDERLATLFHKLGIVLFELGGGVQHRQLFDSWEGGEGEVTAEIGKIPFGRPYRDLVKTCLTGSLYATSSVHIDTQFDRAVVER